MLAQCFKHYFLNVRDAVRVPAGNAALPHVRRQRSEDHDPINSELHSECSGCIYSRCVIKRHTLADRYQTDAPSAAEIMSPAIRRYS